MTRRFTINSTVVNDPDNWNDFIQSIGREGKYRGLFKQIPSIKLKWFGPGKDELLSDYNTYGSAWKNTTLLVEKSTDLGLTYTTEFNLGIDFKETNIDYDGQAQFVEVGIKQIGILEKFQSRDNVDVDLQSLTDQDEGTITAFTNETFDITLDAQTIEKVNEFSYGDALGPGSPSEADVQNKIDRTIWYNLPWDTKDKTQLESSFIYPANAGDFDPLDPLEKPVIDNDIFENCRLDDRTETVDSVFISLTGEVRVDIDTDPATGNPIFPAPSFKIVYVGEQRTSEGDVTNRVVQSSNLTANVIGNTQFNVPITAGNTLTGPFDQYDRFYVYLVVEGITSISDVYDFVFNFNVAPTVTFDFRTNYPDTTCKVMLIHDYIKRLLQSMTGLNEPMRSDYYGNTNATYPDGAGGSTAYLSDGNGAMRGVTNIFQVREFPIAERPMIDTFEEFYKFMWGVDTVAVGLEFSGTDTYFRIEPIEYFYDKNTQILDFSADGFRPKRVSTSVDSSLSYNKVVIGDKNYKDEKFGILDAISAIKKFSIFVESENTKTYDISIPQITNGTIIELSRRKPFADFEKEDTTYDDNITIIELRRTGASTFERDKDQDFTSINGIEFSDTVYNLKLTPKRRLNRHLKVLGAHLWGVINNPADFGNPNIKFIEGKGNSNYDTQLTTEVSAVDENADIVINSTNIDPLYTDETHTFEVPVTGDQKDTLFTINQGYIQTTSRGVTYKIFLDLADPVSVKTGRINFKGKKVYE